MSIQQNNFKTIADSIRACLGTGDSISPSSFAEKVSAVNETAYEKGYEKGLEEADGVKMACGYKTFSKSLYTFDISGLGFKPKDIRILTFVEAGGTYTMKSLVWKESVGGKCRVTNGFNTNDAESDARVTTTDDSFSASESIQRNAYSRDCGYYWFAFAEEQEGGYV